MPKGALFCFCTSLSDVKYMFLSGLTAAVKQHTNTVKCLNKYEDLSTIAFQSKIIFAIVQFRYLVSFHVYFFLF